MNKFRVLGIYRLPLFSNNAIEADRMILEHAIEALKAKSSVVLDIDFIEEPEISKVEKAYDLVLTMAQSVEALQQLDAKRELLPNVWNSTNDVRNCYRKKMSELMEHADLGYAPFELVQTANLPANKFDGQGSLWLKRGDFHAISDDDVTLAETPVEARAKMRTFAEKGVKEVIVQKHVPGDIYKFYGIANGFFTAIRVRRFLTSDVQLDIEKLKKNVQSAAKLLDLLVYGGDCILMEDGSFQLIDLNDWPSFRICREPAAAAIGSLAAEYAENYMRVRASQSTQKSH